MKKKADNPVFTGRLRPTPVKNNILCRIVGICVIALGILMLFRYSMASASYEPLGLYHNQIEVLLRKGVRVASVTLGSSAFSFILPGIFTTITGVMVLFGSRAKVMFGISIALTLLCGSIGRLLDSIFTVLPPGQVQYTSWLLFGSVAVLVAATVLVGREFAKLEKTKQNLF